MTARVRSPPHPTEDCWTGMTAQMEHSKCNDVCVILGVIEVTCRCVCHVQRLMHQSPLKWGRLFLSAVGILVFFFSLPAVSTSPCKKWITEVCDCNWPRLNLHLPLVFFFSPTPHSSSISQPTEARSEIYSSRFCHLDFVACQCQQHALRRLPCRKSTGNFPSHLLPLSPLLLHIYILFNYSCIYAGVMLKGHFVRYGQN